MALKNSLYIILFLLANVSLAKNYPELIAKQANENIRFISQDGRFTYYQKRSGSLHFSRNYRIFDVLKGAIGTQYTVLTTKAKRKIVIMQNEVFHTFLSIRMKEKIFTMNYGDSIPTEIGLGIAPALHLDDNWISYYDPYLKIIYFQHTANMALKFSIKLNNAINPYFIPQVVMVDDSNIFYTDLGENGNYGLINYKRGIDKSEVIYKVNSPNIRFEINLCGQDFIFSELSFNNSLEGSKLSAIALDTLKDFKSRKSIYNSELSDTGHIVCDDQSKSVYFIKNFGNKKLSSFDIAQLEIETKKITQITELKTVSTIINMDGMLLTFDRGKYLIIKGGETDFKNIDTFKKGDKPVAPIEPDLPE